LFGSNLTFRRHGLEKPHNLYQFLTVSIFFSDIVFVSIVYIPLLPSTLSEILIGIYLFLVFLTFIFWIRASSIDPSDPRIYGEKLAFKGNQMNYCTICRNTVEMNSKHCAKCDRCTEEFDHHCEWLNNCVGSRNYRSFFMVTVTMTLLALMKLSLAGYLLIGGLINEEILEVNGWFMEKDKKKYLYLIAASSVKDPFVLIMLLNLLGFHIWLKIKGISTYQYLMNKKNKGKKVNFTMKNKKENKKNEENNKKNEENIKKKEENINQNERNINKKEENIKKNEKKTKENKSILLKIEENLNKNEEILIKTGEKPENLLQKNESLSRNAELLQKKPREIFQEVIPEESELTFTKESVRITDKIQQNQLSEIKIKKPFQQLQENSHRSAEIGLGDEESLNISGKKIVIFHEKT